jgi:hypothetical protein
MEIAEDVYGPRERAGADRFAAHRSGRTALGTVWLYEARHGLGLRVMNQLLMGAGVPERASGLTAPRKPDCAWRQRRPESASTTAERHQTRPSRSRARRLHGVDTPVMANVDRLARSLPDARNILDELTRRHVRLSLGGSLPHPTDLLLAKAEGRLRGNSPS